MKRRTAIVLPISAAVLDQATRHDLWDRLALAFDDPASLDEQGVQHLERGTLDFFRQEEFAAARLLVPGLRKHVHRLASLIAGGPPDDFNLRLLATVGEALALYGWFAFDVGDVAGAVKAYDQAEAAA